MDYIKIRFVEGPKDVESALGRTLDDMLDMANPRFSLSRHRWRPQIDIVETATEIIIRGEIAGVCREEIQLEIGPTAVKISGVRESCIREQDARYHLAEISCGYYERRLILPTMIDTQTATAVYRDGLLEIRLTKRPLEQIRRIDIHRG